MKHDQEKLLSRHEAVIKTGHDIAEALEEYERSVDAYNAAAARLDRASQMLSVAEAQMTARIATAVASVQPLSGSPMLYQSPSIGVSLSAARPDGTHVQ